MTKRQQFSDGTVSKRLVKIYVKSHQNESRMISDRQTDTAMIPFMNFLTVKLRDLLTQRRRNVRCSGRWSLGSSVAMTPEIRTTVVGSIITENI